MADQDNFKTQDTFKPFVRETRATEPSGSGMALLVGGLVVAVGFILWFIFGAVMPSSTTPVETGTTNITIEPPATAPVTTAPADTQPDAAAPATGAAPVEPLAPATPDAADPALVEPAPAD